MGLEVICPRCGGPMKAWSYDIYGEMCRHCKKNKTPPSEKQIKALEELFWKDSKKEDRDG